MINYKDVTIENLLNGFDLSSLEPIKQEDITLKISGLIKQKLPPWYCFIVFWCLGNGKKAEAYIKNIGLRTERGNVFLGSTITFCAWEWILLNPEKGRVFVEREYRILGKPFDDEVYYDLLLTRLSMDKANFPDSRVFEWMTNNLLVRQKDLEVIKRLRPNVYKRFSKAGDS